ncbi:MAG TPA: tail fiber domain-containing protein [Tenuifilaceae bacterium]|jgi:hypothetical protein|nr:tail fiber domain-containing protein [Bacteroidales bacterium]MDI9515642.1 tail fiber domain-containing protein [Bacteroidota bacterium]NLH56521.1 hypothetical protein [Rikenellaceae bacterium]OQC62340.1 MAG: hypothetical protein BWX49_01781 [Bacteroidetes bacterium ADurb.Bin008]HNV81355.1 tail fiber domain-containing protein [Tenuifilaceae bacterium]
MKKAAIIITGVILSLGVFAQVPQGFNYQAVVRNDQGAPIAEQQVGIRLTLQDEVGNAIYYSETHSATTSPQGVVNFVVGGGNVQSGAFADIPWTDGNIHMKIEVDPAGGNSYTVLGVSQMQSVPYALHAQTASRFEAIPGNEDQALFEVRNSDGKVVFAVYEQGVRIYVDGDPADEEKGNRSGFAIGGLTGLKDTGEEYFRVSRGYTQVMFDDEGKGNRSGFAIGGLTGLKDGEDSGRSFFDVTTDVTGIINPSQNRVMWYPIKNSFLTGKVLIEHPDSVGENSFASGYESKARGLYSQAIGYMSIARGDYSSAFGRNALAHANNSFAFGWGAKATKGDSYAFGGGAEAVGLGSYAIGSVGRDTVTFEPNTRQTIASGNYSFALGLGAQATGSSAFAIGQNATASNVVSFALGSNSVASGRQSTALGALSIASGNFSMALNSGISEGYYSTSMGYLTKAAGANALSIGSGYVYTVSGMSFNIYNSASGSYSVTIGNGNSATRYYSTAIGYRNTSSGEQAIALGSGVIANSYRSVVIGSYNYYDANNSYFTWVNTEPLFVVGNGTSPESRSNALTVLKSGMIGIGTEDPTTKLDINGTARIRYVGSGTYSTPLNRTADGTLTTATSDVRLKTDIATLDNALNKVLQLRGVSFKWKDNPAMGSRIGFIAQEMEPVLPELVFTNEADGYKGVNYAEVTAVLVEAVKEQQKMIEELKAEIEQLKKNNTK